jgi:hypothetical protein
MFSNLLLIVISIRSDSPGITKSTAFYGMELMAFKIPYFLRSAAIFAIALAPVPVFAAVDLTGPIETVERLRQQKFSGPVRVESMSRAHLRKHLEGILRSDLPSDPKTYFRALAALRLIDRADGADKAMLDLYESQVVAFYDPKSATYYSVDERPSGMPDVPALDAGVAIHELTHALQDQAFGAGRAVEAMKDDMDGQLAYHAVIEGEAMLVMIAAMGEMGGLPLDEILANENIGALLAAGAAGNTGVPESVPAFFIESAKFPYFAGLEFVIEAYRRGGWEGVNKLHANRPRSTEQLLHPELYFDASATLGIPDEPRVGTAAGKRLFDAELGEFGWRFLLGDEAAKGWNGDAIRFVRGAEITVLINTSWDSVDDAQEFVVAYRAFLRKKKINAKFFATGNSVRVAYGPDAAAVSAFIAGGKSRPATN